MALALSNVVAGDPTGETPTDNCPAQRDDELPHVPSEGRARTRFS
jgi:hypothetical protein